MENDKKKLITREEYNQMIDRIIELSDQVNRLFEVLKDYDEGREFTAAFNDNVYLELAEIRRSSRNYLIAIMEHLLKLKYCINNRNHNDWRVTIIKAKNNFKDATDWKLDTPNTAIINELKNNLQKFYNAARNEYINNSEDYDDLKDGVKYLPEQCPWEIEQLVNHRIDLLIMELPDPDELTVQIQLSEVCIYYDKYTNKLDSKIIGKQCSECENYPQCIADYYEEV